METTPGPVCDDVVAVIGNDTGISQGHAVYLLVRVNE
jgi:hypothetical protein